MFLEDIHRESKVNITTESFTSIKKFLIDISEIILLSEKTFIKGKQTKGTFPSILSLFRMNKKESQIPEDHHQLSQKSSKKG